MHLMSFTNRSIQTILVRRVPLRCTQARPASQIFSISVRLSQRCSSSSGFTYRIAAAYTAKDCPFDPSSNIFSFNPGDEAIPSAEDGVVSKNKKRVRHASGEDAFFVSAVGESRNIAFGVADGVGGWANSGVDPADFSHGLCSYMADTALGFASRPEQKELSARQLIEAGYSGVVHDKSIPAGGSTACVAIARRGGSVEVANLGDSGFLHIRLNAVHYQSTPQTHGFNTPYQLSVIPPLVLARTKLFGSGFLRDLPKDADVTSHTVKHGDVLIFATDGVWDNVSAQNVLRTVSRYMSASRAWESGQNGTVATKNLPGVTKLPHGEANEPITLQALLAAAVAAEAKAASLSHTVDGPFAKEVQRRYPNERYRGGKVDDICVIAGIVLEDQTG